MLMMADGALPIWSALDQVWPETAQQRCWNHKIMNVLDALPKRGQGKARALLTQIPTADACAQAEARRDKFAARYKDRYPNSGRHPRTRLGALGHLLRLSPAALEASAHNESGGESLCLRTPADQRRQTLQASPKCHGTDLARIDGRRKTLSKTQCLRAVTRSLCRTEVPGWKAYPGREDRKEKDEKGRLISFTHLLTQPLLLMS